MRVLLLKTPEPRVPQAHTRKQRLRVVCLTDRPDIQEKLSEEVIHGVTLLAELEGLSFGEGKLDEEVPCRVEALQGRVEEASITQVFQSTTTEYEFLEFEFLNICRRGSYRNGTFLFWISRRCRFILPRMSRIRLLGISTGAIRPATAFLLHIDRREAQLRPSFFDVILPIRWRSTRFLLEADVIHAPLHGARQELEDQVLKVLYEFALLSSFQRGRDGIRDADSGYFS